MNISSNQIISHLKNRSLILVIVALLLLFVPVRRIPVIDSECDTYFTETIIQATAAYATVRIINAGVSVIKDSDIELNPAGVGLSIAAGQLLDPVDDMTERLSTIFVLSITSLGVQKIAYEIGVALTPPILGSLLLLSVLLGFFRKTKEFQPQVTQVIALILLLRFALPISTIANSYVQNRFFRERIDIAESNLQFLDTELQKVRNFNIPEVDGIRGTLSNSVETVKREAAEIKALFTLIYTKTSTIVDNLIDLTIAYVSIFLFQVVLLPLFLFWLVITAVNRSFARSVSMK